MAFKPAEHVLARETRHDGPVSPAMRRADSSEDYIPGRQEHQTRFLLSLYHDSDTRAMLIGILRGNSTRIHGLHGEALKAAAQTNDTERIKTLLDMRREAERQGRRLGARAGMPTLPISFSGAEGVIISAQAAEEMALSEGGAEFSSYVTTFFSKLRGNHIDHEVEAKIRMAEDIVSLWEQNDAAEPDPVRDFVIGTQIANLIERARHSKDSKNVYMKKAEEIARSYNMDPAILGIPLSVAQRF